MLKARSHDRLVVQLVGRHSVAQLDAPFLVAFKKRCVQLVGLINWTTNHSCEWALTLGAVWEYLLPGAEVHSPLFMFLRLLVPLGCGLPTGNLLKKVIYLRVSCSSDMLFYLSEKKVIYLRVSCSSDMLFYLSEKRIQWAN